MALTKFEENINIIENLPDNPTLESNKLKKKFDESAKLIKTYINETLTVEIDKLVMQIKNNISSQLLEDNKKKYYVGKLVFDTENVNPSTYLGFGTWKLWGEGKMPVGVNENDEDFNIAEKTGGEKTHKLTVNEMPSHSHRTFIEDSSGDTTSDGYKNYFYGKGRYYTLTSSSGGNQPHNNMPPYITCYIWKRIA